MSFEAISILSTEAPCRGNSTLSTALRANQCGLKYAAILWADTVFRTLYSVYKQDEEVGNHDHVLKYPTLTGFRGFPQPFEANSGCSLGRLRIS